MELMRQEVVADFPRVDPVQAALEVEDRNAFDSAIGIVVGLGLGLISWAVIVALWLAVF